MSSTNPPLADALRVLLPAPEEAPLLLACLAGNAATATNAWATSTRAIPDLKAALSRNWPAAKRLLPLLSFALTTHRVELDHDTAAILRAAALWEERRWRRIQEILGRVLAELEQASLTVIVGKGIALSVTAYPKQELRHCHDIDLLVTRAELDSVRAVLARCDIHPVPPVSGRPSALSLTHKNGLPLNLHFSLLGDDPISVAAAGPRARTAELTISGIRTLMPHPTDMLVQLFAQVASGAARDSTTWVADSVFLLARHPLDGKEWDRLLQTTMAAGLALPGFVLLEFLRAQPGVVIPPEAVAQLRELAANTSAYQRDLVVTRAIGATPGGLRALLDRIGWRSRLAIVRSLLLPSPAFFRRCGPQKDTRLSSHYLAWHLRRLAAQGQVRGGAS